MTMGTLAVIAVSGGEIDAALTALDALGASPNARSAGGERVLVTGQFPTEPAAREAVATLRARGWAAIQRPMDGDPFLMAWQHRSEPIRVADGRLVVALPWAEYDRDATPIAVEIDPGGAFGGGNHPTTKLLLEVLVARLRGGERVLDVGCGSGVLAVAAVRLGAAEALGIDIDPAAVIATRANAVRNALGDQVSAQATPLRDLPAKYDAIVANIGLDVLVGMAPDLEVRLAPGGWLALSGVSPAQESRLMAAFARLRVVETTRLDDWLAIVAA